MRLQNRPANPRQRHARRPATWLRRLVPAIALCCLAAAPGCKKPIQPPVAIDVSRAPKLPLLENLQPVAGFYVPAGNTSNGHGEAQYVYQYQPPGDYDTFLKNLRSALGASWNETELGGPVFYKGELGSDDYPWIIVYNNSVWVPGKFRAADGNGFVAESVVYVPGTLRL